MPLARFFRLHEFNIADLLQSPSVSINVLLRFRMVTAVLFYTTICLDLATTPLGFRWPFYLTHLCLLSQTLLTTLNAVGTAQLRKTGIVPSYSVWYRAFVWLLLYSPQVLYAILVPLVYWIYVDEPHPNPTFVRYAVDYLKHGILNSFFCLDVALTTVPLYAMNAVPVLITGVLYLGWMTIHAFLMQQNGVLFWIYRPLDPTRLGSGVLYVNTFIAASLIYIAMCAFHQWKRDRIIKESGLKMDEKRRFALAEQGLLLQ